MHIAGRAYDTGHGGSKATTTWPRVRIMLHAGFTKISMAVASSSHCQDKTNSGVVKSSEGVGRKGQMSSTTDSLAGIEQEYWMGTEIGRLEGYSFQGTVKVVDGSIQKGGKLGAGYMNLRAEKKRQQRKVGRDEEGSSSNCLEPAAFVLALYGIPVTKLMLYLCDNQALLKAVERQVGEGGKAMFEEAPDADILQEAIEQIRKRKTEERGT